MPRNKTLKRKLALGGIVAVCIPFFIAGSIIYVQLSKSLIEMTEEKLFHFSDDISHCIDTSIYSELKVVKTIASDHDTVNALKNFDFKECQSEIESIYERIGQDFFTLFVADKYGIIKADASFKEQVGIDISDRNYFVNAKKGKSTIEGPIFPRGTATPGDPIAIVATPVIEVDEFIGIVAMAFSTDFLADLIAKKRIGKSGYPFIANGEGLIIAHPDKALMLTMRPLDLPGTEGLVALMKERKTGICSYTYEGTEKLAAVTYMDRTGWFVIFTQNRNEIMAPVNDILFNIFISGIIFLFITIITIFIFSSKFSTPIQKIMELMKHITQHSTEIILQIGMDRRVISVNPAFEKITGIKKNDIIGSNLPLKNPDNISEDIIWSTLESGNTWSGHFSFVVQNTNTIILDVIILPIRNESGLIQGYMEIGRDITSELAYEKRLQQAQKLEAIGTLAGGIAHDFNNILSGIFGYAELSLMKKDVDSETERYIREIIKASERARDLVSQILTFSRQTDVQLRPLQPKVVIKEALKLLRASIPATIEIESTISSDSAIMAEPTQIHQVIMNLFTNAAHAIGDRTGTIRLELEDFVVGEDYTRVHPNITEGNHVLIRVTDTGGGIAPEVLDQIFEPFFTTKAQGKGTGLGLSVVHGIVKQLGGIVTAYSEVGKGTVFNVIIPCMAADGLDLREGGLTLQRGTERIAVLDDEGAIATTTASILTNLGYKVTAFAESMETLKAILSDPDAFDLIITD